MDPTENPPLIVRATKRLEDAGALDGPVRAVEPWIRSWFGSGTRGALLRGDWLGHALHPVLTDAAVGTWVSATLLDVLGGEEMAPAAQRLIGLGLLSAGPTAWTGWAEWSAAGPRAKRVGLVHAVTNGVAIGAYAASWVARRRGRHGTGRRLALAGTSVAGVGAYLGGHLAVARKVGTYDPAYDEAAADA
ncbi:MAG: DUF2231 domain-containing protein [Nocardioides sp.]